MPLETTVGTGPQEPRFSDQMPSAQMGGVADNPTQTIIPRIPLPKLFSRSVKPMKLTAFAHLVVLNRNCLDADFLSLDFFLDSEYTWYVWLFLPDETRPCLLEGIFRVGTPRICFIFFRFETNPPIPSKPIASKAPLPAGTPWPCQSLWFSGCLPTARTALANGACF